MAEQVIVIPENEYLVVQDAGQTGGQDGRGIENATIISGDLVFEYTDGTTENVGRVVGTDGTNGTDGNGIASSSYNPSTGILTLTYTNGTTFSTGDLRGSTGNGIASTIYDTATGVLTFTYTNGSTFSTGDIRGAKGDKGDKGDTGNSGITNLRFQLTAPQHLEPFAGNSAGTISQEYVVTTQNGGALTQRTTPRAGFPDPTLVDFLKSNSSPQGLVLLRKSASAFIPTFQPTQQLCELECSFALDQLPTSADQHDFELRLTDTANNNFSASANGVQARIYWDTGLGRAAIALTTMAASLTSTEVSGTTLAANTVYVMRILYNQPAGICQLFLNGVQVASRTLRLPTSLLTPSLRIAKVSGSNTFGGSIDYILRIATNL